MILKLFKFIREEHTVGRPPSKKGQRVLLRHDSPYQPGDINPKEGSSYHCEGTITDVGGQRMVVRWDNDRHNDYSILELRVIPTLHSANWHASLDSDNPNITFKTEKEKRELIRRVERGKELHSTRQGKNRNIAVGKAYFMATSSVSRETWS